MDAAEESATSPAPHIMASSAVASVTRTAGGLDTSPVLVAEMSPLLLASQAAARAAVAKIQAAARVLCMMAGGDSRSGLTRKAGQGARPASARLRARLDIEYKRPMNRTPRALPRETPAGVDKPRLLELYRQMLAI